MLELLREDDYVSHCDLRYLAATDCPEIMDDKVLSKIKFRINKQPPSLKMVDNFKGINWDKKMDNVKAAYSEIDKI